METSDGLFAEGEVAPNAEADGGSGGGGMAIEEMDPEEVAKEWLDGLGGAVEVATTWEAVQAAKAASQDLYREGKVMDALEATTAAIGALKRLAARYAATAATRAALVGENGEEATKEEIEKMFGVLHSNRSLLVQQLINAGDSKALAFGPDAAWRLVVTEADKALSIDASNYKASFRRARAHYELGELSEALADATRVVDYYARTSSRPNPEAAELRELIQTAIKKEKRKWGDRGSSRWNRAVPLITEVDR